MRPSSQVLDRIAVTFDDEHVVASAGLILPATHSQEPWLEAAAEELAGGGAPPGPHGRHGGGMRCSPVRMASAISCATRRCATGRGVRPRVWLVAASERRLRAA